MRALAFGMAAGLVVLLGGPSRADDLAKLEGSWEGLLKVNDTVELRLIFRVEARPGEGAKVTMESPDQGAKGIPVDAATFDATTGAVAFGIKPINGRFEGKRNQAGDELTGTWKQAGMSWPLALTKTDGQARPAELWEGTLKLPNDIRLRLLFHLTTQDDGGYRATMDSPDQGANGIKVDEAVKKDGSLKFTLKAIQGEFTGKLNPDGTEAAGEWKQLGVNYPLTLKKVEKATEVRRPQNPKPPFPYRTEEIAYGNTAAKGVKLAGTLSTPKGPGPFPAVLLITGSGPQDRNESLLGHSPFLVLADALTRRGIAVLRVDDRGVGKSTGDFATATSDDFAGDALAGVAYLKSRSEIDPKAIGLVGHSEGGLIAPMVATRSPDVAFIVLMAGTGLTGAEILEMQAGLISKAMGATEETAARQSEAIRKLAAIVVAEPDAEKSREAMKQAIEKMIAALPESERKAMEGGSADSQLKQFSSPWFRYFLGYDPRPTLRKVRCPVLAINGEKDLQVPPRENLAEIEKALKTGGNTAYEIHELPGLNHLFQESKTGAPSEYGSIEETINPAALKLMADWILKTSGRAEAGN